MSYRKILVAIDHSPQADIVFERALELAKKEEASLMVCHCLPFESPGVGSYSNIFGRELINYSQEIYKQLQKEQEEAGEWLANYGRKATAEGVLTEWDLRVGEVGNAIQELVNSWGADLVVVGRRGRQGLAEIVLGSVSNYIVHHVPCSVLVVQGISPKTDDEPEAVTQANSE